MSAQITLNPYLAFAGNCREAMNFYKEALEAELNLMTFENGPTGYPIEAKDKVLHASLSKDGFILMASDTMPGQSVTVGTNVSLSVSCISDSQVDQFFSRLSEGGVIVMPLQNTFWNSYFGMLTDKFGISWMISHEKPAN